MKSISAIAALAATMTLAVGAQAADNAHRQEGPHVHGHGTLAIAVEGDKVEIELEVPGADIVGFEHPAGNAEETAKVEKARKMLADALALFKLPADAGCKLEKAAVEATAEDHDEHGDDHAAGEAKEEHEHGDHDEHGGHSEFHAHHVLTCAAPERLTTIEATYFTAFPAAQSLSVTVATGKGQTQGELTRDKPTLDLGGVM